MAVLTVATRGSDLAIRQTEIVISALETIFPNMKFKLKQITTEGDRNKAALLWELKNSGFFTSQLEEVLLKGQADFAVHSLKDLPCKVAQGLTISAVLDRRFASDCMVCNKSIDSLDELKTSAKVGTCSLRRAVQLKRLRPDLQVIPIRGNVKTRVKLVEKKEFDAVVLATAGVERLNMQDRISFNFDPDEFIPAPAQGAIAVQTRTDDSQTSQLVSAINDKMSSILAYAERQILVTSQCGCHAPVGSYAKVDGDNITIDAFVSDPTGRNFVRKKITGPLGNAMQLAEKNAVAVLEAGGKEILEKLQK